MYHPYKSRSIQSSLLYWENYFLLHVASTGTSLHKRFSHSPPPKIIDNSCQGGDWYDALWHWVTSRVRLVDARARSALARAGSTREVTWPKAAPLSRQISFKCLTLAQPWGSSPSIKPWITRINAVTDVFVFRWPYQCFSNVFFSKCQYAEQSHLTSSQSYLKTWSHILKGTSQVQASVLWPFLT